MIRHLISLAKDVGDPNRGKISEANISIPLTLLWIFFLILFGIRVQLQEQERLQCGIGVPIVAARWHDPVRFFLRLIKSNPRCNTAWSPAIRARTRKHQRLVAPTISFFIYLFFYAGATNTIAYDMMIHMLTCKIFYWH